MSSCISNRFLSAAKQQQSSALRCLQILLLVSALFAAIEAQFFFNPAPQFSSYDYTQDQSQDDSLSNLFNTQSSSSGRYYNEEEDENGNIRTGDDLASLFLYCRTCGRGKRSVKNQNAT